MSTLKELQDRFQNSILTADDAILADVKDTSKEQRAVLFGVYRHAYGARLVEILQSEFPILYEYLGDEQFEPLARSYVVAHPSRFRNARWFGGDLPGFLRDHPDARPHPEIADLADIEKALSDAFDAEDAAPITIGDLAAFAPDEFPKLSFSPHPSARRLDLATNALDVWTALSGGETPPKPERLAAPMQLLFWRQGGTSRVRPLPPEETMLWTEARKGVRFGVLCELLATFSGPDGADMRAAGYLKGWLDSDALAGISAA